MTSDVIFECFEFRKVALLTKKGSGLTKNVCLQKNKKEGSDKSNPPFQSKNLNQPIYYLPVPYNWLTVPAVIALLKIRNSSIWLMSEL